MSRATLPLADSRSFGRRELDDLFANNARLLAHRKLPILLASDFIVGKGIFKVFGDDLKIHAHLSMGGQGYFNLSAIGAHRNPMYAVLLAVIFDDFAYAGYFATKL